MNHEPYGAGLERSAPYFLSMCLFRPRRARQQQGLCPALKGVHLHFAPRRNAVQRQQGMDHLKPERIPEILDEELPQQAIAAAFRKYKK